MEVHVSTLVVVNNLPTQLAQAVAQCYATAFAYWPWNEAFVDAQGDYFGLEFSDQVEKLGLKPAYPLAETTTYIQQELANPSATLVTVEVNGQLIGFCWGYTLTVNGLIQRKYIDLCEQDQGLLLRHLDSISGVQQQIFYFSECAVHPEFQNRGVGKLLVNALFQHRPADLTFVVRTHFESPMVKIVEQLNSRVSRALGPREPVVDPINSNRVLFYIKPLEKRYYDVPEPGNWSLSH